MSDRVPIGTIPGAVSALVGTDVLIVPAGATRTVVSVFLRRTGNGSGDVVVADIRDATGGGGSGITVTLADGDAYGEATGALAVSAAEPIYLRVTAADSNSADLTGWIEIHSATASTTALTNLTRVKAYKDITDSASDSILNTIIAGVSDRMQREIRRTIVSTAAVGELHDGNGRTDSIVLDEWPVISFSELRDRNGDVVDAADYVVDAAAGLLLRVKDGAGSPWDQGRRNYAADYTHGFATVPEALAFAADKQCVFEYQQAALGDGRLGTRSSIRPEGGGTTNFLTGPWAPGVLPALDLFRDRRVV